MERRCQHPFRGRGAYFALWLIYCLPSLCHAQGYSSPNVVPAWQKHRFEVKDGLPHNTVTAIGQDNLGYLWIGTSTGLARYDGYEIIPFSPDSSWSSHFIKALTGDELGYMWIGTEDGLHKIHSRSLDEETVILEPAPQGIQALFADGSDLFASSNNGVYRCQDNRCRLEHMIDNESPLIGDFILAFAQTSYGHLLGQSAKGRILIRDASKEEWRVQLREDDFDGRILMDPSGTVWLMNEKSFIGSIGLNREFVSSESDLPSFPKWIPHDGKLMSIDRNLKLVENYLDDDITSTLRNHVRSWFCTDEHCWYGTLHGLYRIAKTTALFQNNPTASKDERLKPIKEITSIEKSPDGVFLSSLGMGMWRVRDQNIEKVSPQGGQHAERIWDLTFDSNLNLWIGADNGLFLLEAGDQWYKPVPFSPTNVQSVVVIRDSLLAVGSLHELQIWDFKHQTWQAVKSDMDVSIHVQCIVPDQNGNWLIGTNSSQIFSWDGKSAPRLVFGLPASLGRSSEGIWDIYVDRFGTIWAASDAGLTAVARSGDAYLFRATEGLSGNIAYAIEEDENGRLWVSTDRGLSSFEPDSNFSRQPEFRRFSLADGLSMLEFNRRAAAKIGNEIWFGGVDGWTIVDPAKQENTNVFPPIYLHSAEMRGAKSMTISNGFIHSLQLPPFTRAISLYYGAVDLAGADHIVYKYRLSGVDNDTIHAGSSRQANYSNLRPGKYEFQIWSTNRNGIWNPTPTKVPIIVEAAIWETTLFKILVILCVVMMIWLAYRMRVRQLLAIERMRLRIAADLHDQIGSGLSSLGMMMEMAAANPQSNQHLWRQWAENARNMAKELREIVWYTNPKFDRLDLLIERMKDLPYQLLPNISLKMKYPDSVPPITVSPDFRRDWMLSFREILHNAAKHSKATELTITLELKSGILHLIIFDNGIGLDLLNHHSGMGLQNIRNRIDRLKGEVSWKSSSEMGTMVEIKVPLP